MQIKKILQTLEAIAPLRLQEGYDNAGLICGNEEWEASGALICLDSTEEIIDEAITLGCNLVIAHHPIVFKGLKRINGNNYVERTIIKAIKNDIAIYAIHTNLDNVLYRGVNAKIAEKLELSNTQILAPKEGMHTKGEPAMFGAGLVGELADEMEAKRFLEMLKTNMQTGCIRHTKLLDKSIKKVALCGGSGSFLLSNAIKTRADIFITGDFKYHEFFDAENHLIIADIGHFESEQFTIELLFEILSEKFRNFALHYTKVNTNPVQYF